MENNYTLEDVVKERFEATKQRGKYLAYIVKELDAAGFKDFDDAVKRAIFKFGKEKSLNWGTLGAKDFMNNMISDEIAVNTMEAYAFIGVGRCALPHTEAACDSVL